MKYCVMIGVLLSFTACNTVRGVGEDISASGRVLQGAAIESRDAVFGAPPVYRPDPRRTQTTYYYY